MMYNKLTTAFFRSLLLSSFFAASLLTVTGSIAMSNINDAHLEPFHDQGTTAEAKAQIGRWMTPDTTVVDAIKILESRGFSCKTAMPQSEDIRSSVFCSYSPSPPPPPNKRFMTPVASIYWTVILDSKNGTAVTDFQVSRFPKALGE